MVRRWHAALLATEGVGPSTVAKAYRLVHAVCASAVAEEHLVRNPCAIPGASAKSHDERPVATISQVYEIADALGPRWRTLVLTATFCGLRFGELAGLTVERVDLLHKTVTVAVDLDELDGGHLQVGRAKSDASRRTVSIPDVIVPELERHLGAYSGAGATGYVFVGPQGGLLRRSNFRNHWTKAVAAAGDAGPAVPRPAAYGQHPGGGDGGEHPGADAEDGSRLSAGGVDLPARDEGARRRDRCVPVAHGRAATGNCCGRVSGARRRDSMPPRMHPSSARDVRYC